MKDTTHSLYRLTLIGAALAASLAGSGGAQAQNDLEEVIVVSKMTGACGMLNGLATFQEATKMAGGDEFLARFLATESARLGETPAQFVKACRVATEMYTATVKAVKDDEPKPTSGPSIADRILADHPATIPSRRIPR